MVGPPVPGFAGAVGPLEMVTHRLIKLAWGSTGKDTNDIKTGAYSGIFFVHSQVRLQTFGRILLKAECNNLATTARVRNETPQLVVTVLTAAW